MTGLFAAKQDLSLKKLATNMLGVARLNAETIKQLRDDPTATLQSIILVPIIGLSYGIGLGFGLFLIGFSVNATVLAILLSLILACFIALLWSLTNFLIVTRLYHRTIGYQNLTRPFLFSWTPGLLFILVLSPGTFVSEAFQILATAWVAVASVFAVRHASGLTFQQSIMVFVVSMLILVFALIIFESLFPLFLI